MLCWSLYVQGVTKHISQILGGGDDMVQNMQKSEHGSTGDTKHFEFTRLFCYV